MNNQEDHLYSNFDYADKQLIDCMCPEETNHESKMCGEKSREFLCSKCITECYKEGGKNE